MKIIFLSKAILELANTALTLTNVKQTKTTVIIMKLVLIFLEVFDVNVPKDIQVMGSQVGHVWVGPY